MTDTYMMSDTPNDKSTQVTSESVIAYDTVTDATWHKPTHNDTPHKPGEMETPCVQVEWFRLSGLWRGREWESLVGTRGSCDLYKPGDRPVV